MPIRPENRDRYPDDWPEISARVREEAGQKCEWCSAPNGAMIRRGETRGDVKVWRLCSDSAHEDGTDDTGAPVPDSNEDTCDYGSPVKVILTVAHLGLPAQIPLFFHVTRNAVADEVFEAICFLMPLDTEEPKWRHMMHNRATTELFRRSPTGGAGFFVAMPSFAPGITPAWPVVFGAISTSPVWVRLSTWGLLRKPFEAASVSTKATSRIDVEPAYREVYSAALASGISETTLRSAYCFSMTGVRTSTLVIRRLLRSELKNMIADDAGSRSRGFARSGHASLYHIDDYPENCARENLKALCQRCHNVYDAPMRRAGIAARAKAACAVSDLFEDT